MCENQRLFLGHNSTLSESSRKNVRRCGPCERTMVDNPPRPWKGLSFRASRRSGQVMTTTDLHLRMARRVLALAAWFAIPEPAPFCWWAALHAQEVQTHYVDVNNLTPAFPYTTWASAATNLQHAIEAGTQAGRLVLVRKGVYRFGTVARHGLNRVALLNGVHVVSVDGPDATTIEGAPAPGIMQLGEGAIRPAYVGDAAVLSGFTLTRGYTTSLGDWQSPEQSGGGAWCESSGVLTNCIVNGNRANVYGGGVYGGTLFDCQIDDNGAQGYGGAVSGSTLYRCTLSSNGSGYFGGGADRSTLYNCLLRGNTATWRAGGALGCTLYDCVLTSNVAMREYGGGALGSTLHRCTLTGNSAFRWGGGASDSVLHDCTLSGNSATLYGGGGAAGCALYHCTLIGNRSDANGGGVRGYETKLYDCTLISNSARVDGGAAADQVILYNCILINNSAGRGGGAYGVTAYNCTITGNSAEIDGGGVLGDDRMPMVLYNSIVYFNTCASRSNHVGATFKYSCTTPLPAGAGNIDADPRFVNVAAGNLRLQANSSCIDAGTNLVDLITTDIDGRRRPLDGDGDGVARFDIGAYELDPRIPFISEVVLTPNGLHLGWSTFVLGSTLQRSASLTNPLWQDVPGSDGTTSVTVPMLNDVEFFRLRRP